MVCLGKITLAFLLAQIRNLSEEKSECNLPNFKFSHETKITLDKYSFFPCIAVSFRYHIFEKYPRRCKSCNSRNYETRGKRESEEPVERAGPVEPAETNLYSNIPAENDHTGPTLKEYWTGNGAI